jgi:organic radical activating enzyme
MEEWQEFIEGYPEWISLIAICGGEPTLITWMPNFVNWLLDRGHHVIVYSNLWKPWYFTMIKKSFRFYIQATFHHTDKAERFTEAYNYLIELGYKVEAFELNNEPKILSFTKPKKFITVDDGVALKTFHCAPDAPRTKIIYRGSENLFLERKAK